MKLYITICVNEEHKVVSCNAYKTLNQAVAELVTEYRTELIDKLSVYKEDSGSISSELGSDGMSAHVTYGDCGYFWEIKETEIPD